MPNGTKGFFCKTFVCLPFSLKEKPTNKQTTVKGSLRVRYFLVVKMFYSVKYNFQRLDFVGDKSIEEKKIFANLNFFRRVSGHKVQRPESVQVLPLGVLPP